MNNQIKFRRNWFDIVSKSIVPVMASSLIFSEDVSLTSESKHNYAKQQNKSGLNIAGLPPEHFSQYHTLEVECEAISASSCVNQPHQSGVANFQLDRTIYPQGCELPVNIIAELGES